MRTPATAAVPTRARLSAAQWVVCTSPKAKRSPAIPPSAETAHKAQSAAVPKSVRSRRFTAACRHASSGAPYLIARHMAATGRDHIHVVNAGDGRHAHPTQGLLDMYTIRHYKKDFTQLTVAIVGDVLHSRVARSQIHALTTLGVPEVRVIAPKTLLPTGIERLGVRVFHDMREGLRGVDVVMMLRLQNERMQGALLPSTQEYFKSYGLTPEKLALAKPDAIVMHPGPMNRGVEIDSAVADGGQAVILPQVTFGIAVRMAVMAMLAGN